ncbi:hypothetical protein [Dactylosporangium sp. NPDC049140]|uniref:hypothetical protein n=1 Tax=Dactylosporangium sp. NPDC049140 TaxID=3155647 RepID=UPI0033D940FC
MVADQNSEGRHGSINGAKTILLVGTDTRPDQSPGDAVRSDSIIVVHVPADHSSAYLIAHTDLVSSS